MPNPTVTQLEMTEVASGLGFPEAPVMMPEGASKYAGSLLFVEMMRKTVSRLTPEGKVEVVASIPPVHGTLDSQPNGLALGPDGALYICNNGGVYTWTPPQGGRVFPYHTPKGYSGGGIQRLDLASGVVTDLYSQCDGQPLLAPDDLVFDGKGGFWFTATGYQEATPEGGLLHKGGLYYALANGSRIARAATIPMANGVGLSWNGKKVYVADTIFGRLWELTIDPTGFGRVVPPPPPLGMVAPGHVLQTLPDFQWVDSLAVEAHDPKDPDDALERICVGTIFSGCITIVGTDGSTEQVPVKPGEEAMPTNLCFGGADMRDVWITASTTGKIYRTKWLRPGLKLAHHG